MTSAQDIVGSIDNILEHLKPNGQGRQALDRLGLEPAKGQFLDSVGQPAFEEAAVIGWRLGIEQFGRASCRERV